MEEPLKPSTRPTKSGATIGFFALHVVSYLALAVLGVVAMIKGSTSDNYKTVFSIALQSCRDFKASKVETQIELVQAVVVTEETSSDDKILQITFPYHGMLMVPEKAITYIILIWMVCASIGGLVILIMKGFSDNKLFTIAFGKWGQWTSVSMLCTCAELIIPFINESMDDLPTTKASRYRNIACLLLSMGALIILVMAYGTGGKCEGSTYAFVYKKVIISTFFAFHLLYSIFSLVDLEFYKKSEELYKMVEEEGKDPIAYKDKNKDWYVKFYKDQAENSWVMMLLVGVSIAAIGYLNSEVCMPIFISVFQLGYFILSFGIPDHSDNYDFSGLKRIKIGNIVASIIMFVFLIVVAVLTYIFKKEKIFQ